jgi:hypothetical protein
VTGTGNSRAVSTATGSSFLNGGTAYGWSAWPERIAGHLFYWCGALPRGGQFAAFEQPGLFVTELHNCFRGLR